MPPVLNVQNLQPDVVDVRRGRHAHTICPMFTLRMSYIDAAERGLFSDSHCAELHKKKFITKEPQARLKNLHLRSVSAKGAESKWMQGLLCTRPDWGISSVARSQ
jgi:hypothetical protein